MLTQSPRSVRNNNPGNMRKGIQWDGLSGVQTDPDFCVFISAIMGFRALAIDTRTKWQKGLRTIEEICTKRSPPNENDTASVIKAVSAGSGIAHDAVLNLDIASQLTAICRAIAVDESGGWFFSPSDLAEGVRLALPQRPSLVA